MAWIDYRKEFDSVLHDWILKALELFKVSPILINFLWVNMSLWRTILLLSQESRNLQSNPINIRCVMFQGDSLAPFLFCLALIPLSLESNSTRYGYKVQDRSIVHLFFMDDLKLFAKDDNNLGVLQTVKFSDDIGMSFGLDKCAKVTIKRGKLVSSSDVCLDRDNVIKKKNTGPGRSLQVSRYK